jgi:hypothetical protein
LKTTVCSSEQIHELDGDEEVELDVGEVEEGVDDVGTITPSKPELPASSGSQKRTYSR